MSESKLTFIRVTSTRTLCIYSGLDHIDKSDMAGANPNRLKVTNDWVKHDCLIKAGSFYYPSVIKDWPTFIELSKKGIFTWDGQIISKLPIGEEVGGVSEEEAKKLTEQNEELNKSLSDFKAEVAKNEKYKKQKEAIDKAVQTAIAQNPTK